MRCLDRATRPAEETAINHASRLRTLILVFLGASAVLCGLAVSTIGGPTGEGPNVSTSSSPRSDVIGAELTVLGYVEAASRQQTIDAFVQLAALAHWPAPATPVPAAFSAPARHGVAAPPPAAPLVWTDAGFASAVLDVINARRAGAGLAPLSQDARITYAASSYAAQLLERGGLTHTSSGTTIDARLRAAGFYDNVVMGEVLAGGTATPSPESIVALWMNSATHHEQLLSATFRLAGAGCAFDGSQVNCVVNFAG